MITQGIYKTSSEEFSVVFRNEPTEFELFMGKGGQIVSAYKKTSDFEGCYLSDKAKTIFGIIKLGINGCTSKNGYAVPFDLGASSKHTFTKTSISFTVEKFNNTCCAIEVIGADFILSLDYCRERILFPDIPYVKLTKASTGIVEGNEEDIPVRTLEEIALGDKDITWLKKKKYYVVNDEAEAEKIFTYLENYNGVISFDTETTGLRINMFGEIGSQKKRELEEYNANLIKEGEEPLRIDKLVGFIYCVERDVSYYFPCFNRKFKNLYENTEDEQTKRITDKIKASYTIGEYRDRTDNMANYIRNTPVNEWGTDVILMERNRKILESKQLLAHNGTYEWKVCWLYHIDFNLTEDTMIMHQLMFKFRDMTKGNRGEPSNLKHLTKVELGCDQLDLKDYFAGFEEDQGGEVRSGGKKKKKKSKLNIDFSYMDYEGTRAYAPADGDFTFQIFLKYKKWMLDNMPELEYIYKVEIIVSCAIAQMEYYGHRIDEEKIENIKQQSINEKIELEHKIRKLAGYSNESEDKLFELVEDMNKKIESLDIEISSIKQGIKDGNIDTVDGNTQLEERKAKRTSFYSQKKTLLEQGTQVMASSEKELNLASPAQVTELFFTQLKYPFSGEKPSVAKKQIKSLVSALDENKQPKYPVAKYYSEWKKVDTLLTKFFDNLPYFMYPGGYIFSSFGQISTATGRMSCNKPNAQQYPKAVTGIVIPRPGHVMMDADFSQIEYRTLVAMANEEQLKSDFFDPDMDYHTKMASLMYSVDYAAVTGKMRSDAKSFNFGIPYGMGFGSLAILLTGVNNDATRAEAKEKYELYFKDQPKVRQFFEDVKESALVNRYTETRWHRRRYYSFEEKDGTFSNKKKAMSLRQAGNAVIQGCLGEDTLIQTKEYGIVKIKDVANQRLHVWNGTKWSNGDITYSGKKQKCVITFTNGQKFVCSPIHKFLVKSHKGNERFVECKALHTVENYKSPHRIVITHKYEPSDWKYSSKWAYGYKGVADNSNNVFLEDIGDSFKIGVVLGRLASDGSILKRDIGASCIIQFIAEHELNIVPELESYMNKLRCTYKDNAVRDNRNEKVNRLTVYSKSLVEEIRDLDIKHQICDNIFMDTELLRGFLRGFFDGDGGISGKTISLTFGTQADFELLCRQIQKALLFFGIRSRYYKYDYRSKITIKTNDNQKFLDLIGFMNEDKQNAGRQLECIRDEHIFGQVLIPQSVEITDEYIDMYDVCNTDEGYYVADGIITHNTAADIFKISVARNFSWIRRNNLIGKVLIVNMIHDEQLMEIDCSQVNVRRALADIILNMEMKIDNFPPLYVGAGVAMDWKDAKGEMAEIHPVLANQLISEAANLSLDVDEPQKPEDVANYFGNRVLQFRINKVADYVKDQSNYNKPLHPVIGKLLALQFDYGVKKEFEDRYNEDNGYTKEQIEKHMSEVPLEELRRFIEDKQLDVDYRLFQSNDLGDIRDEKEDDYDDDDEADLDGTFEDGFGSEFALIDSSNEYFGVDLRDIIDQFGLIVSQEKEVCGIDITKLPLKMKDSLFDYLEQHGCDPDDEGAVEVVFLMSNRVLKHTDIWVNNITGSEVAARLKLNSILYR